MGTHSLLWQPIKDTGRNIPWGQALCAAADPDWFHSDDKVWMRRTTRAAIEICNTPCPIKNECLQYALVNEEKDGVWGGLTSRQRTNLLRKKGNDQ